MTRARVTQRRPRRELTGFPRTTLKRGKRVYRAARMSPWWFCSCGGCRFDLASPDGTLYLGDDALVGVIETIGGDLVGATISIEFLRARRVYSRRLGSDAVLANLTSRRAAGFGVTNELSTMTPYAIPRAWAAALSATTDYDGIRYRTRFDTGAGARGIALFGEAGERNWSAQDEGRADAPDLIAQLKRECSITVVGPPRLDQLDARS